MLLVIKCLEASKSYYVVFDDNLDEVEIEVMADKFDSWGHTNKSFFCLIFLPIWLHFIPPSSSLNRAVGTALEIFHIDHSSHDMMSHTFYVKRTWTGGIYNVHSWINMMKGENLSYFSLPAKQWCQKSCNFQYYPTESLSRSYRESHSYRIWLSGVTSNHEIMSFPKWFIPEADVLLQ